jgi:hypothetical protein
MDIDMDMDSVADIEAEAMAFVSQTYARVVMVVSANICVVAGIIQRCPIPRTRTGPSSHTFACFRIGCWFDCT